MLPDVDQESYAQYSADQFTSSATDRINALAAVPTPDPGLTAHLGGGPSPDVADAPPVAPSPPEAAPGPDVSLPPTTSAPASAPPQVQAPPLQPQQQPQSAQPDWIAGALNAVDQAGGDVQKFAQGLQTGAGDLVGSALNAADAAGADVQKFVSALPPVPGTATPTTDTGPASTDDQTTYIRQAAAARGINPDTAVKVASSEGLNTYVGDNGSSFGPFQLHYGGVASGGNAVGGLGDEFTRQTGLDARDPSTWRQQVDFALNQAAQGGWSPWHGAARVGIAPREGISSNAAPAGVTPAADQADRVQTQTVSPSTSALMSKVQPFLGDPYVWGGKDPNTGFDCSGFVGYVEGTGQPESTTTLYAKSGGIDQKSAQPGDLVFYNMGQSDMHLQHVGVYLGNGKIAQAGGTQDTVNVADVNQKVGSAPEFRRLDAGSTPPTAGQPAQVAQVNNDPIGWLGQQKDALTSSIGSGASALGAALQPQVSQPVTTQTMPSDSLTDPIGTRYTVSPSGQPQAATTRPDTSAAPQDATSATPQPQGPLEAVKQKFSDAIDALGGLLAPAQPAASAAAGAAQDFAQNGPIGATRSALQGATNYVTSGQAKSDIADTLSSQADQSPLGPAVPAPVQSAVLNTAAGFLRSPTVLESAQTVTNLTQKYAPGQLYIPDESVMTPEDRRAYEQARLAVGGLTGGEGATYDKFGVQEGFVPPAAKQAQPAEPAAPSNPFELTAAAPAGAQPLTQDEVVGHLEYLDSLHAQNDARLSELQNQLEGGYFKNASGDRGGGGIVRPPQFAGWTDQAIIDYARREGLNPYQVGWFGGGKGELEGYARSVGATKGTATQARAEVAQIEAQQSQIEAAMENGWNAGSSGQPLYRQSVAPAALPWDNGAGATNAAESGGTPANVGGGTPRPAPQAAGGAAQAGTPSTVEPAVPGLIPNANRARANAADIASGGTRAERLAPPPPPQGAEASDTALQGLISMAKQRGIDTSSIEAQIKPPITADMITSPGPAEGPATDGGRIQPTQPASEARSVREIVSTTVANKQGPPGITVEPQGFLGRSTPEMGSAVVYRDKTGMPQGILSITNDEKGNPDVAEVAVNPAFQRQGIATQLYQAARDAGINVDAVTGRGGYTPQGAAFAQSRIDRGLVGSPTGGSPPGPPAPPTGPTGGGGQPPYQSVMPAGTFETPPAPASGIGDTIANVQRNLTRAFTDRQVDVNQVQQAYQKALGRPLNADEMAAELQRLSPDAVAAVKIDEGLKPAIQSVGNDYQALRDYVTLRSNVEVADALGNDARNFSGGMTAADSQQAIQTMQDQLGPQRFAKVQQAADQVTSFNQDLRQRLVDSGVLSPTQAAQMDTMYPNWAKTRILDYMADPAGGQGAGTKIGLADRNLRQYTLEGTTRAREDPIASTVAYAHQVERMANKNEAFNAMQQIDQASPNPQLRQVAQDFSPTKDQVTMVGFQNGQKLKYVTDNKALGEAINGAGTMSAPSWVSAWTKFVRATATSRNPLFLAGNAALDIPTYAFRSTIREGGPTIPALGRVFGQLAKGYADAFQGLLQGEYRGAGTSAFLKAGGGQSGYFTGGEGEAAQRIADLQRSNIFQVNNKADLLRLTKDVLTLKPVEGLGERIELGPRVAAYNLAKQRGANPVQAATEGRTVTVDFSQGGTVTKYLNNFIPFFNVGFQGPAQLIRAFRENPRAFVATTGTLIGVPSVAAEVWNHADPQRWQDYQDVPDYVKNQGIVIMSPGAASVDAQGNRKPGYAVIKLREWAPFAQIARSAADVAFGDNQRTWQQMAASIGTGLSPTNATSVSQVGSEPLAGIPALPAALQLQQNRDFFRNRNIVTTRNDQNASALAKGLAPLMQRAVDAAGLNAEIRPSAIDFFIRDQGAGAGGAALGASDLAAGTPRQDTSAQSLPGVGGLIGRFSGSQTGQNLQSSRDVGLTPSAREILRSNGITTTPGAVSSKVNGIPLKLDEEARYQDLFNRYSDDAIQRAARSSDWSRLTQQGKQSRVQQLIDAARSRAGNEVLNSLPAAEKQQRLRVGATAP